MPDDSDSATACLRRKKNMSCFVSFIVSRNETFVDFFAFSFRPVSALGAGEGDVRDCERVQGIRALYVLLCDSVLWLKPLSVTFCVRRQSGGKRERLF